MSDYEQGKFDCIDGISAGNDKSEEYLTGWGDQYALEQNLTNRTEQQK